ncbi:MAG: prolyl oligopeptidase family serine peptidase [Phaeodactylibacter sp.]|uniref:prolyl oligopeptidase family serine peptidase n=1 Tax=Phaeodactylibacter sp. TaxID=1940289 RepID=UPI0032EE9D8E
MRNKGLFFLCCAAFCISGCQSGASDQAYDFPDIPVSYPETPRDTARTDSYAGYKVSAPYHWLEQTDSAMAQGWISEQAQMTGTYLSQLPGQAALSRQLDQLQDYVSITPPRLINGAWYFLKSGKGVLQGLYRRDSIQGPETQLIDPEAEGWAASSQITGLAASADGELLALKRSVAHSEWEDILIYDLKQEAFLRDTLQFVRHSNITWYRDGFFYSRYARPGDNLEPYLFQQMYYHRAGTDQSEDELVYADRSDPRYRFETYLSQEQGYLLLFATNSEGRQAVYARSLNQPDAPFSTIAEDAAFQFEWAGADATGIYLITNLDAPNRRLVRIDPELPDPSFWETILPAGQAPLQSVHWTDGKILAVYQTAQGSAMALYDTKGKLLKRPKLPDNGCVLDISSRYDTPDVFISYGHLLEPPQIYRLDLNAERMTAFHTPVTTLDPKNFKVSLVQFKSYDETELSMYIARKIGTKLNGKQPVLLFAGGRKDGPFAPMHQTTERLLAQLMLEQGGICAIPALRGGSALQTAKRRAGQREYKQNTFDDFQAAAEYLIANDYTKAAKIAVYGEGHGALIAAASLAQRPDLFGAVAGADGMYDLLRYPELGSGWKWLPEFGDPADPKQFDHIFAYSPVQKLTTDQYPATMLLAHQGSDAVMPVHTWKMGAVLQHQQSGNAPVLVYPVPQAQPFGRTGADVMAFLLYHLKTPVKDYTPLGHNK